MKSRSWLEEQIYFKQEEYFGSLLMAIQSARYSIEVETYIFEMDPVGRSVIEALIQAASRGVRVRVLVDGMGTWFTQDNLKKEFKDSRVQFRIYHPFSFFGIGYTHVNKRLHRKLWIFDHETAFTGSFNITGEPTRDTGVRLKGGPIGLLSDAFERVWSKKSENLPRRTRMGWVRLNENKKMRRSNHQDLIRRIREAKSRIWITSAYFVPPFFVLRALCRSGLQGRDVRLLLPARPDHIFMKWMAEAFYRTLLLSGVRVFEFEESFLHSKTILIDDWAMVGSTNLNHRSLVHDLEVDVVLHQLLSKTILQDQFEMDLKKSRELEYRRLKFSWLSRIIQWALHFFRFYA
jgi:cardiolipin synthase